MKKLTKFERELKKEVFKIANKYGYDEIAVTGTVDPKWYKRQVGSPGLTFLFYRNRIK